MANTKSSKKDLRRIVKRRARNLSAKSALKTFIKKARISVASGDVSAVAKAVSAVDKASQRGIIHKNQAARRKSRVMKAANKAAAAAA
ncbi:MAG: 30S ribosomal protein S20 [Fimbriimonas sp.]